MNKMSGATASPIGRSNHKDERSECEPDRVKQSIGGRHDDYQQEGATEAHVSEGPAGYSGATPARRDDSRGDRPRPDSGQTGAPARLRVHSDGMRPRSLDAA